MSLLDDLTGFFHNAATGELTDAQKADIAQASVNEVTACAENWLLPECQSQYQKTLSDINKVAPSTGCVFRIPGFGSTCFHSWESVIFSTLAVLFGGLFLWTAIITSPRRRF